MKASFSLYGPTNRATYNTPNIFHNLPIRHLRDFLQRPHTFILKTNPAYQRRIPEEIPTHAYTHTLFMKEMTSAFLINPV